MQSLPQHLVMEKVVKIGLQVKSSDLIFCNVAKKPKRNMKLLVKSKSR